MDREVQIRAAGPADAEGVTRVYLESALFHAGIEPERYLIPDEDAIVARYREGRQLPERAENGVTLIAEIDGAIVGFADVRIVESPDPMHRGFTYSHVVEVAVSTAHRSQGIGGRLLEAAEDWGREKGAEFASLEYLVVNERAGELYQRKGYHPAAVLAIKRLQ